MGKTGKEPENQRKLKETSLGRRKEDQRIAVAETKLLSGSKLQRKRKEGDRGQHLSMSGRRGDPRLRGGPTNQALALEGTCPPDS